MNAGTNKLTMNSKIGELYATPVGHDTLSKVMLQMGVSEKMLTNPVVSNLKLKTIATMTKKQLGQGLFDALLGLVDVGRGGLHVH